MAGAAMSLGNIGARQRSGGGALREGGVVKWTLIAVSVTFLALMLALPLTVVLFEALRRGWGVFAAAVTEADALAAVRLTLLTVAVAVPANMLFGVAAAWAITKFRFRGKSLLVTMIDVPFSISPVIAGMIFVLLLGSRGVLGEWVQANGLKIIFAPPGIILATTFVTFPFIARELIPLMDAQGREDEEAAVSLGAPGWKTFLLVTLPNIKWGLIYGVILCNARAMGEFGAVSVVSGHIRGETNTMPLHIEVLYGEYQFAAAFGVAALLVVMAILTLVAKCLVEWKVRREIVAQARAEEER